MSLFTGNWKKCCFLLIAVEKVVCRKWIKQNLAGKAHVPHLAGGFLRRTFKAKVPRRKLPAGEPELFFSPLGTRRMRLAVGSDTLATGVPEIVRARIGRCPGNCPYRRAWQAFACLGEPCCVLVKLGRAQGPSTPRQKQPKADFRALPRPRAGSDGTSTGAGR